ncbi:hypothetical protein ACA910_003711 [Epithemia clementina (nom. ined.)]
MSSNINSETGEYLNNEGRSPRFSSWVFLMVCSVVTLKASTEVKNDVQEANSAAKWAVACSAITFSLSFIVLAAHLIPLASTVLVGSKIEGFLCLLLVGFWTATVSIVTNTDNDLGAVQSDTNEVSNGNLYYFSWAGFVLSIVLIVSYLRSAYGLDLVDAMKGRASRLTHWAGLLAATMVVMGSSARIFNKDCHGTGAVDSTGNEIVFPEAYCTRTKFAISIGAIGVFFSLVVVAVKLFFSSAIPFTLEFATSSLLTVLNVFGVAYITSNSGPGRAIGNLYYFTWISFILAAVIAVECFNASKQPPVDQQQSHQGTEDSQFHNSSNKEVSVDNFPDGEQI